MISKNKSFGLLKFDENDIKSCFSPRQGETKLGEVINNSQNPKYVILGIEESVGPRANQGRKGCENAFKTFLAMFLNMQSNESLIGDNIHVLGKIVQYNESTNDLSSTVEELDDFVLKVLMDNIEEHQIPIVIGGGHNNAFPLIHFSALRFQKAINVVNLDAHADYRLLEGRHSGNPFSYAFNRSVLNEYQVFGLHQRYNSQRMLDDLSRDGHSFTFNEEYLSEERNYFEDFKNALTKLITKENHLGIELDLDVISRMPSSAYSPVGISIAECRRFLRTFAQYNKLAYLHLPEGAPQNDEEDRIVGKTLAYFVSDFIIANS